MKGKNIELAIISTINGMANTPAYTSPLAISFIPLEVIELLMCAKLCKSLTLVLLLTMTSLITSNGIHPLPKLLNH